MKFIKTEKVLYLDQYFSHTFSIEPIKQKAMTLSANISLKTSIETSRPFFCALRN